MDYQCKLKREQVIAKYDHFKKRIRDWELAVYKTDGRKPTKDDMKKAPKEVQDSYKNLIKMKKYLEDLTTRAERTTKVLTPRKLFLASRRKEFERTEPCYLVQSPAVSIAKSKKPVRKLSPEKKTLGLRSSRSSLSKNKVELQVPKVDDDEDTNKTSSNGKGGIFAFKSLFNMVADAPGTSKKSVTTLDVSGSKNLEEPTNREVSTKIQEEKSVSMEVAVKSELSVSPVKVDVESKTNDLITAHALKNTRIVSRFSSSKRLDFGWLSRIKVEDEDQNQNGSPVPSKAVKAELPEEESLTVALQNKKPFAESEPVDAATSSNNHNKMVHDTSGESISFSEENVSSEMDVDVETPNQAPASSFVADPTLTTSNFCVESTDSGIGLNSNSLFSSDELHQAVEEVLAEKSTKGNATSGPDASLIYSFSEETCLPSDGEDFSFTEIENTIPQLINAISESIDADDESSRSTHCSNSEESQLERSETRKRSAKFAFSPSPVKAGKRKFFKSTRAERCGKYQFSPTTYKPPSPKKRVTRSVKPTAKPATPRTPKLILQKVVSDDENSNQDVWTSKVIPEESTNLTLMNDTIPEERESRHSPELGKSKVKSGAKTPTKGKKRTRPKKTLNYDESDDEAPSVQKKPKSSRNVVVDIFDEAQGATMPSGSRKKFGRKFGRKQETLESKMKSGKVDDNFVRIDLKRKRFVRGHKKISAVKLKRLEWKNKKSQQGKQSSSTSLSTFTCHKCGEKGHYSKFCVKDAMEDEPPGEEEDCPLPTLEEAARMVFKDSNSKGVHRVNIFGSKDPATVHSSDLNEVSQNLSESMLSLAQPANFETAPKLIETLDPFFPEESELTEAEEDEVKEGLRTFGYDSFRPGQKEAICRVLKGKSTLLILSTGSGKSLCYQLPAYLYGKKYPGALTLCISPLVSLMEDQIQGLPEFLNAACLHSNMTEKQKTIVLDKVKSRSLNILLVSPEAVCGGLFGILKGSTESLPKISFACIDEVHCVSQWSHNFRPSYLQLCKILREKLNVRTILGLTATATSSTAISICEHLSIDPSTTIRGELIPRNLKLSVSRDVYKDEALIQLLHGDRFRDCDSIIIYCTRREECERIATLVRTKLQTIAMNKIIKSRSGAKLSGNCEAYHAGMTARRRKNVQDGFMSGDIRIVVATVAFGMGIDKSDIRAVIHYNMPSAFESYVQEIGRAGRDGLPAHCHLFLDNAKLKDLNELKRHVYANSVDRPTIRKLLRKVFRSCKCKRIDKLLGRTPSSDRGPCEGHEVSFAIEKAVLDLDLPKENITTLLCYLELDERKWIEMLPLTYEKCKIQSYGGPKLLKNAASRCPPLAVAIALLREKDQYREADHFLEFNVIDIAATVGWNSGVVKKELKNLEWTASQYDEKGNPTRYRKSGLLVEFSDLAYRVKSCGSLSDEEADEVLNTLHARNVQQEQTQIYQLHRVYEALLSVSLPSSSNLCDSHDDEKSNQLKKFIYEYFSEDSLSSSKQMSNSSSINSECEKIEDLRRTIRNLIFSNRDTCFTTRAVARILQGISSPCFPADVWFRNREFWRKYMDVDFHLICKIAAEEM